VLKLSEKHTNIIHKFVSSFSFDKWFPSASNEEFEALTLLFDSLHGKFINKSNARHILILELASFRFENRKSQGAITENANLERDLLSRLVACIESFPRSYFFSLELPRFPDLGDFDIEISDNIKIKSDSKTIGVAKSETQALVNALEIHQGTCKRSAYLQFRMTGYGNGSAESPVLAECISLAKQCAFILTMHKTFIRSFDEFKAKASLETVTPNCTEEATIPDSLSRCFGSLLVNEEKLSIPDNSRIGTILNPAMRIAATNSEKIQALPDVLGCLSKYFSYVDHADFQSISAAIEWYQDSTFSDNQTLAFLSACIGLEALLGDESHMDNMTNRLADRYSFLMGSGRERREKLRKDYKDVLSERGKLVHARKARLSSQTSELLEVAQRMLLNVIWHELHQMYKMR
jgi:hypothetical protein